MNEVPRSRDHFDRRGTMLVRFILLYVYIYIYRYIVSIDIKKKNPRERKINETHRFSAKINRTFLKRRYETVTRRFFLFTLKS